MLYQTLPLKVILKYDSKNEYDLHSPLKIILILKIQIFEESKNLVIPSIDSKNTMRIIDEGIHFFREILHCLVEFISKYLYVYVVHSLFICQNISSKTINLQFL